MTRRKPSPSTPTLAALRRQLRQFAAAREWEQFHTPKNLAMALSVEAAELLECFQWLTPEQSARPGGAERRAIEEEMADVLLYLLRLSDVLGVDLPRAAQRKMAVNARKYPVALARGNARKYSRR
ncbi:MAG: nucleotide pyrophosphohydrolase [Burkholderiales bacterium]|jgi:NTP pyrophosphatase (non-canonical NTP hydrolase)|nr:nucleotide pyrophosphohydrolase [Burkholderiales bacterium]